MNEIALMTPLHASAPSAAVNLTACLIAWNPGARNSLDVLLTTTDRGTCGLTARVSLNDVNLFARSDGVLDAHMALWPGMNRVHPGFTREISRADFTAYIQPLGSFLMPACAPHDCPAWLNCYAFAPSPYKWGRMRDLYRTAHRKNRLAVTGLFPTGDVSGTEPVAGFRLTDDRRVPDPIDRRVLGMLMWHLHHQQLRMP